MSRDTDGSVVGHLVTFLARRERLVGLAQWASESSIAVTLERLGDRLWGEADLLFELAPLGSDEFNARESLQGLMGRSPMAALAATRFVVHDTPEVVAFVERLRLLLLVRSIEAALESDEEVVGLADLCVHTRHICERSDHSKWKWFEPIQSHSKGLQAFADELADRCEIASNTIAGRQGEKDNSQAGFFNGLRRLAQGRFRFSRAARGDWDSAGTSTLSTPELRAKWKESMGIPVTTGDGSPVETGPAEELADAPLVIAVEVDPERPAAAQHVQSSGLILQSIEDVQYLRHSWHRLSRDEEERFLARIAELLTAPDPADRMGAALTGLAVLTSTPLSDLAAVAVGPDLANDWTIDLKKGALRRKPPRFGKRWRAGEAEARKWVRTLGDEWRIELAADLRAALRGAAQSTRVGSVGDLWRKVAPSLELSAWFNERFVADGCLQRLSAPVVVTMVPQLTFEHSHDHTLSRLVGSSTRTALPSACTYGSFTLEEVRGATAAGFRHPLGSLAAGVAADECNAAGSELDAHESVIARWVSGLTRAVDSAATDESQWAEYHNRLTCLVVAALFASTGARPVSSPFESLTWIDTSRSLIYVEDKRSGPTRGSRLCVLTDFARQLLLERYLPHLTDLARALRPQTPTFADEIDRILARDQECVLPLFFFLRRRPSLDWVEVNESRLGLLCGEPWPLPWNAFRHLHSTQLRRRGLHPEIRDALLGHGDRGAESHGDFSWRTPQDDLELARPLVNSLTGTLGFRLPRRGTLDPSELEVPKSGLSLTSPRPYGRRARTLRRQSGHEIASAAARAEIDALIAGRPLSSLAPDDWDRIAAAMLYRDGNLPHPTASLRYEVFEAYLEEAWGKEWRKTGRALQLGAARRVPLAEGEAIFTEDVIDAPYALSRLRKALDHLITTQPATVDASGGDTAGCLAALEIALHCRVSSRAVLSAVCRNQPSLKVVRFQGRHWLENSYHEEWKDGRPNYRVPITELAAHWIQLAQAGRTRHAKSLSIPKPLLAFAGRFKDFESLLEEIARLVGQTNSFELPGALAAVLAGRLECAALPHADWIRATHLAAPLGQRSAENPTDAELGRAAEPTIEPEPTWALEAHFKHHHRATSTQAAAPLTRCIRLFEEVSHCLQDEWRPQGKVEAAEDDAELDTRRRSSEIQRAIARSGFGRGDAAYLLADYARHLLSRDNEKRAGKGLKVSTARRYWLTIRPGVLDFAYDTNLSAMDEDELTELYQKIVRAAEKGKIGESFDGDPNPSEGGGHAQRRSVKEDSDAGQRAANELFAFHDFASERYGLEEPDWMEVAPLRAFARGRPGIVLEAEYDAALKALVPGGDPANLDDDSLSCAFVLLICGRFGLRIGEAVGMQRSDWLDVHRSLVVLVRSNGIRTLKTIASKRQVPLVGRLSDLEQAVAEEALNRWQHRAGLRQEAALVSGVSPQTYMYRKRQVAARLLPLLKSITRNNATTVHHLRHGFACRLLTQLHGSTFGLGLETTPSSSDSARRLLLGSGDTDRRVLWSVARTLGHSSPRSTVAYLHVFDAWVPRPAERRPVKILRDSASLVDLDKPLDSGYLDRTFDASVKQHPLPSKLTRYLRYLRLRAAGHSLPAQASRLEPDEVERLESNLIAAAARLASRPDPSRPGCAVAMLLGSIRLARWNALLQEAPVSELAPLAHVPMQWAGMVGRKRQILLFLGVHFDLVRRFLDDLSLTPQDCVLLHEDPLESGLDSHLQRTGLAGYCRSKRNGGRAIELDRAFLEGPKRTFENRLALVPMPAMAGAKPRIETTQELVVLWAVWLTATGSGCGVATPAVRPNHRVPSQASSIGT